MGSETRILVNRRKFVLSLVAVGSGLALGIGVAEEHTTEHTTEHTAREQTLLELSELFSDKHSTKVIAKSYFKQHPEEKDIEVLFEHIFPNLSESRRLPPANSLRAYIQKRIRHDFTSNQTISLRGWILSKTEVRLSALVSIIEDSDKPIKLAS